MPPDFCMTSLCFPSIPFIPGCLWTGLCVCADRRTALRGQMWRWSKLRTLGALGISQDSYILL